MSSEHPKCLSEYLGPTDCPGESYRLLGLPWKSLAAISAEFVA